MKKTLLLAALGALSVSAHAQFFDNFESYALGPLLTGGWGGWDNTASVAGDISTAQAYSGTKSVAISTNGDPGFSDYTDAVRMFSGFSTGKHVVRTYMYLPAGGNVGSTPYFILLNKYDGTGLGYEWSVQLQFRPDGKVQDDMNLPVANQTEPNIAFDQWVPIHVYVDLDLVAAGVERGEVRQWYNWQRIESATFQQTSIRTWKGATTTNPTEIQCVDLFVNPAGTDIGDHYYDDFAILANTHTVQAAAVSTTEGEEFSGDLASLAASDDNRYQAFNDGSSLGAKILVTTNSGLPSITAFTFNFEVGVERPGLTYGVYFMNYTTNAMQFMAGANASTTDTSGSVAISTDAMRFMNGMGQMQAEFRFIPLNDEEPAADGWLHNLDVANYSVTAF